MEQPGSSVMRHHPAVAVWMVLANVNRVWTYMGGFGHSMLKPSLLLSTLPLWLLEKLIRNKRSAQAQVNSKQTTKKFWRRVQAKKYPKKFWVTGMKDLKSSEQYTQEFGAAVARLVREHDTTAAQKQVDWLRAEHSTEDMPTWWTENPPTWLVQVPAPATASAALTPAAKEPARANAGTLDAWVRVPPPPPAGAALTPAVPIKRKPKNGRCGQCKHCRKPHWKKACLG